MIKALALVLAVLIFILAGQCLAGERKPRNQTLNLYDRDWNRKGYVRDGQIYDRNWNRRGYIKDGTVYDKDWNRKGHISRQK